MMRTFRFLTFCALSASSLALAGCGQSLAASRKYYILDVARQAPLASFHSDATLRVHQFHVDQAFMNRQLIYRVDESRYEPDFYDQFLIPPGVMITEQTRDWLADSGLFKRVSSTESLLESTYVLEGNVIDLYGNFTNKSAPEAVVAIRFYLLTGPEGNEKVVLAKRYRAVTPVSTNTAEAVVDALGRCLEDILTRLEVDIEKVLQEKKE